LTEAAVALGAARVAIKFFSFSAVGSLASHLGGRGNEPASAGEIARVRSAVLATARLLPLRTLCFECGLAAQMMLWRRGYCSTMHYGAALNGSRLRAHVWVKSGEGEVVGAENAGEFSTLATFPDICFRALSNPDAPPPDGPTND
jgi:hypothetical protein